MARRFKRKSKQNKAYNRATAQTARKLQATVQNAKQYVLNLSKRPLTDNECLLLSKGLKFIPNCQDKNAKKVLMKSFTEFVRKLRCKYHFHDKNDSKIHPFRVKSGYKPEYTCNVLEQYIELTKLELSSIPVRKGIDNITPKQRLAIKTLKGSNDIVIKKADKSNTIVILDKEIYIKKGENMLQSIHYTEAQQPNMQEIKMKIENKIHEMSVNGTLDKETINYFNKSKQTCGLGKFYMLPKIHKMDEQIIKQIKDGTCNELPIMPPGRPIVSLINTPSQVIGRYCDFFLLPLVQMQDTYIKDSSAFINMIEKIKVPKNCLLVTFDVTSMYTNMSFQELLDAVDRAYNRNIIQPLLDIHCPPKQDILDLLKIVLENNYFEFNGKTYRQVIGAPQGFIASPEICDIRMHEITSSLLSRFRFQENILFFKRYRDDGIILFNGTREQITELFEIGNSLHDLLKFTYEISEQELSFLDVSIYKGKRFNTSNILDVKSYIKPTNNFQYLHRDSAHPESVFKGFIKGECIRHMRNTNDTLIYRKRLAHFQDKLIDRGYKACEIQPIIDEVRQSNRTEMLNPTNGKKEPKEANVLVTKFNPKIKGIKSRLTKHWNFISQDETLKQIFKSPPIVAYERHKNLGDILTSSTLK